MKTFFYGKNEAFFLRFILTRSLEKTIFFHLLLVVVPTIILSVIHFGSDIILYGVRMIQVIIFMVLGSFYSSIFTRKLFARNIDYPRAVLQFLSLPALTSICLLLTYFITKESLLYQVLALNSAYLLPLALLQAWHLFFFMEESNIKVGYLDDIETKSKASVYLGSVSINVIIKTDDPVSPGVNFHVFVPQHAKLGKFIIQSFLEDKYNSIESYKFLEKNQHQGWLFYEQKLNSSYKKYYDPHLTVFENRLKNEVVLYAKPVKLLTKTKKLVSQSL